MLDNRANWKIDQVREAHNELLDAMMQSYRNLIRFARRNNLSVSASPQDIGVLTRKLYRSEERRVGKECRSRWSPYHYLCAAGPC